MPETSKGIIREECDRMLKDEVMEPSTLPWLSPVVLVKKNGGGIHFCVDYRRLNQIIVADSCPIPRVEEMFDELRETSWFTATGARSAYWSISLHPKDRKKLLPRTDTDCFNFAVFRLAWLLPLAHF